VYHQSHYVPDRDADGQVQGYFSFNFDITRLKLAEAELDRLARKDSLTGVSNRRDFEEQLERAVKHCAQRGDDLALLCLDLDHFKTVNDRFGHPVGDAVIQAFAQRLRSVLREEDVVARLGGDEFMLLIRSPAPDVAAIVAEKVLAAMREPIHVDGRDLQVGVSIGIAVSSGGLSASQLMSLADQALYQAKAAGRNTWRHVRAGEDRKH
jgi:diguanylate cyclase (GGDEF)-like protein